MKSQLERIEIKRALLCNHEFAVKHTLSRKLLQQRIDQLRKITIERFFVATLNHDFFAVAKNQRTKSIPFRLKDPIAGGRQLIYALGEHRENRRIHGKFHNPCNLPNPSANFNSDYASPRKHSGRLLPRTQCGPLTKATVRDLRSPDLKSQIRLHSATYLARRRAQPELDHD